MADQALKVDASGLTDVGRVRQHNEDRYAVMPGVGVFVVADGMGGHAGGEFASETVLTEMSDFDAISSLENQQDRFIAGLSRAHDRMLKLAECLEMPAMGTTVAGLLIHQNDCAIVWSGDSRVYRLRGDQLTQLNWDHSEAQELLDAGVLTSDQARNWPRRNIITKALGVADPLEYDVVQQGVEPGDVFLICSDGLTEHSTDPELSGILMAAETAEVACTKLVQQTLDRGATDNVTVVVVRILGDV